MGIEEILDQVGKKLKDNGSVVIGPFSEKGEAKEFKETLKEKIDQERYVVGIGVYNGKEEEYYVSVYLRKDILNLKA